MLAGPLTSSILFAIARGVPPASITAATGLTLAHLADPTVRLPERHMPAIWRLMQAMFPNEPVSLEMAAAAPLELSALREAKPAKRSAALSGRA